MKYHSFRLADLVITLQSEHELVINEQFLPFLLSGRSDCSDYMVQIQCVDHIEVHDYFYCSDCFAVTDSEVEERYFYPDSGCKDEVYACGKYDLDNRRIYVQYLPGGLNHLNESRNCFYHIALEKILLHEKRMILHSCCVQTEYGEICFSANSGVGKSTQGELWVKYKNARVINGDRTILYKSQDEWMGSGSPYAGSSGIYLNERYPLRVIVMLCQSKENTIRKLDIAEAFVKIYQQVTANIWNIDFMDRITKLIEEIVTDIPVYELSCTPDKRAVDLLDCTLKEALEYENF